MKKRRILVCLAVCVSSMGLLALLPSLPVVSHETLAAPAPYLSADVASITLVLFAPEYGECGDVSINGYVGTDSGSITHLTWNWDDGTIVNSWFAASHHYSSNGTYSVQVTAYSSIGETKTETTTVTINNAQDPSCNYTIRLHPMTVILHDGHITETLRLEIRGVRGELISPIGRQVLFTSTNPSLVQVNTSGVVTSTGFGEAEIEAAVEGIPRRATARVVAGHLRVEPPILLLSPTDEPTGTLRLNVANADGTPMNLSGHSIAFSGGNSVAGVDNAGQVTAHRPPRSFSETPYINASMDGIPAHNAAVIRVTTNTLGLDLFPLEQPNVTFYIPEQIGSFNYSQIFNDYDVTRITDIAYQLERELTGLRPFNGDVQFLVNDPGHGADGTVPCGLSGNPVRLGTDVDKSVHNSCLIVAYPPATPHWGVYFHEMGHNFTWASARFAQFASSSEVSNSNFTYSEGLATAEGMYAAQMMSQQAHQYGIPTDILSNILSSVWHFGSTPDLDAYVSGGADYSQITPSVLDDMIMTLADERGYEALYRFFSVFLPDDILFPFTIDSDAKQATFFVAAMSAATKTDQRPRFQDEWGFPLDEAFYDQIYPQVEQIVAQRDPAADAGRDRTIPLGQGVTLDDAYAFDWEGNSLTLTWQIISRPPDSTASLTDAMALHPSLLPDKVGTYVLSLTASDGLVTGTPDTVNILCTETGQQPVILLLIEETLSLRLDSSYQSFKNALTQEGYQVFEETVSSNTEPPAIKDIIQTYWSNPEVELDGTILIGNIRAPYAVIHTGDYSDPDHQKVWLSLDAIDMYYEDLTGSWDHLTLDDFNDIVDNPPPNVSELHLYPSCETFQNEYLVSLDKEREWDYGSIPDKDQYSTEIWVARIMGHNLSVPGKDEAGILEDYFAWNYGFRIGNHSVRDAALLLNSGPGYNDQGMNYTGVFSDVLKAENVTKDAYLGYLQASSGSRLLYLTAHSWPKGHVLHDQALTASEMNGLYKNSVFYLLNACSACRWDEFVSTPNDPNYMGGLYVFSKTHQDGDFGLGAACFTGVGGFNNLAFFTDYYHSHPGASYGEMFVYWFNRNLQINFGPTNYVFLGDPTIGPDTGGELAPEEHSIYLPLILHHSP
ncbi:MAG: PKD domain-containing protein [Chloroflexota bacterium]|nr:PKD domain-containing protein [Chloroflexota bacterium]